MKHHYLKSRGNRLTSGLERYLLFILLLGLTGSALAQEDQQKVYTGIYLINIYDLDINQHSYYIDCYMWFKWKGERDPMNIEFVNAVEKWGATIEPFYEEPLLQDDGYYYNGMRYEGRFYHAFELERFPLDQHGLDVQIENVDYPIDSLIYLPEEGATYIREDLSLPGWTIQGADVESAFHHYPVSFGADGKQEANFSNFIFRLQLRRPFNYFILKLLLPLLIVISVSLGALLINPASIDARISLPIGGLLSAVFLQQSYNSALPDVGYMVLMDKIYLLVYALIAAILLRVVLVGNKVIVQKDTLNMQLIRKKDRRLILLLLLLLLAGIGILLI
ncbi:MAG: hypothetical protein R2824_04050 [Saprospiraceae bacterium]|nr:hypothetical protein [Lewinella sp.]